MCTSGTRPAASKGLFLWSTYSSPMRNQEYKRCPFVLKGIIREPKPKTNKGIKAYSASWLW